MLATRIIDSLHISTRLGSFSLEVFEGVKIRVEEFLVSVLSGQRSEIKLTEKDINLIYINRFLKDPQKFTKKIQFTHKIEDTSFVQERIICPFEFTRNLCFRFKTVIDFSVSGSFIEEIYRTTMANGRKISHNRQTCTRKSIQESLLIMQLLNPDPIQITDYTDTESLNEVAKQNSIIKQVISNLRIVEIENGSLILKN